MPIFLSEAIVMMTTLVLLFIGIAVVFKWTQLRMIASLLIFKAGFVFLLRGVFVLILPIPNEAAILLAVIFPQSAVSFWPFAHMSAVRSMEIGNIELDSNPTFDLELGINVLAISIPFSKLLILGVFTSGSYFTNIYHILLFGGLMLCVSVLLKVFQYIKSRDIGFGVLPDKEFKDSPVE